jgi:hypothetical protein
MIFFIALSIINIISHILNIKTYSLFHKHNMNIHKPDIKNCGNLKSARSSKFDFGINVGKLMQLAGPAVKKTTKITSGRKAWHECRIDVNF